MEPHEQRGIYELHLEVTGDCNLNCIYCYNAECKSPEYRKNELTLDELKKLVHETKEYGTRLFTLTGGDPFMRKDLLKAIKEMEGYSVSILTNGKLLTSEMIAELKKYPQVKEFKLSWDGFESHDDLRVGSSWKQVEKTIKELKENGYDVVVNTIVLERNQKDLYKLYSKLKELHVDRWRVDIPFLMGRYTTSIKSFGPPDPTYFTQVFKKIIMNHEGVKSKMVLEIFNLYKSQFTPNNTMSFDPNTHPCEYKRELLSMKPNGDIIFCPSLNFAMANYRKEGNLKDVFRKEETHPFYDLKTSDLKECEGCRYLKICGGGCRANAIYQFNDWHDRDTTACATFPEWENHILPILKRSHQEFFRRLIDQDGKMPPKDKMVGESSS